MQVGLNTFSCITKPYSFIAITKQTAHSALEMQFLKSAILLGALASEVFASPIAGSSQGNKSSQQGSKTKKPFPDSHSTPTPSPISTPVAGSGNTTSGSGDLGIPSGLLTSKAGISFGFLPDTNGVKMSQINQALGKKSAA